MAIDIYNIRQKVFATCVVPGLGNNNMTMTQSTFKIYKNSPIEVEFQIKNNDRKPVNLVGKEVLIIFVDEETGEKMLHRDLQIIDITKGKVLLKLFPQDSVMWNLGFHKYSLSIKNIDGDITLLYLDDLFDSGGYFEVIESVQPRPDEAYVAYTDKFLPQNWNQYEVTYYVSQAYPSSAQVGYINNLQTIAIYADNFSGKLVLQGNLENQPNNDPSHWFPISLNSNDVLSGNSQEKYNHNVNPPDENWLDPISNPFPSSPVQIPMINITNGMPDNTSLLMKEFTGIEAFNFKTNAMWIRFAVQSDFKNRGKLTKILYKN